MPRPFAPVWDPSLSGVVTPDRATEFGLPQHIPRDGWLAAGALRWGLRMGPWRAVLVIVPRGVLQPDLPRFGPGWGNWDDGMVVLARLWHHEHPEQYLEARPDDQGGRITLCGIERPSYRASVARELLQQAAALRRLSPGGRPQGTAARDPELECRWVDDYLERNPGKTLKDAAEARGLPLSTLNRFRAATGRANTRPRGRRRAPST